ncbi:MAG TPA: hypothetical protein V6C81_02170 [Planktothrix sp.]|jgi:hypothetical protein
MTFKSYFRQGSTSDKENDPIPGRKYWVVLREDSVEIAFEAMLTAVVKREHRVEPDDRTPSYQFDNGVILHGEGMKFFRKVPEKPLKLPHIATIFKVQDGYEINGITDFVDPNKRFANLEELQECLRSLDVDPADIPQEDFDDHLVLHLML